MPDITNRRNIGTILACVSFLSMHQMGAAHGQWNNSPTQNAAGPVIIVPGGPAASRLFDETFVKSNPRNARGEFQTLKEAFDNVKSGGVIYIMEQNSDVSNVATGLVIDRSVTIQLDAELETQLDTVNLDPLAKANLNAAADGTCVTIAQSAPGANAGRRNTRNEVIIRDVAFLPNPGSTPGSCIIVEDGSVFLQNIAIQENAGKAFDKGLVVLGGDVSTLHPLEISAAKVGIEVFGTVDPSQPFTAGLKKRAGASFHRASLVIAEGLSVSRPPGTYAGSLSVDPTGATDTSCDDILQTMGVGIYIGKSKDARVADPAISIGAQSASKGTTISGYEVGVCVSGSSSHKAPGFAIAPAISNTAFQNVSVYFNSIGIRVERDASVRDSLIAHNFIYGIVVSDGASDFQRNDIYQNIDGVVVFADADPKFFENRIYDHIQSGLSVYGINRGQYSDNQIFNNGAGAVVENIAPTGSLQSNIIAFNGEGVSTPAGSALPAGLQSKRDQKVFSLNQFSGNTVSCNIAEGNYVDISGFEKLNIAQKNKDKYCFTNKPKGICGGLRRKLNLASGKCNGN